MKGFTVWLTGYSGAGKTTLGKLLIGKLGGTLLDGDTWRETWDLGYSKEDRDTNVHRAGIVAGWLSNNGGVVVAAFISPYEAARRKVALLSRRFLLVHVACPLWLCEARDVKGLYARVRAGEIKNFTGIDDPYEAPTNAFVVHTTGDSAGVIARILEELYTRGWIDV